MKPPEIAAVAAGCRLRKVDAQRWEVCNGDGWLPIPAVLWHPHLGHDVPFEAKFAPRKIAQACLDSYRLGVVPEPYVIGSDGWQERTEAAATGERRGTGKTSASPVTGAAVSVSRRANPTASDEAGHALPPTDNPRGT